MIPIQTIPAYIIRNRHPPARTQLRYSSKTLYFNYRQSLKTKPPRQDWLPGPADIPLCDLALLNENLTVL